MATFAPARSKRASIDSPHVTSALQIKGSDAARRVAFAWRHGNLAAIAVGAGVLAALLVIAVSAWMGLRLQHRIDGLEVRATRLQTALASRSAAVQAAQPPDVVQTLPGAPAVAQVMQTLLQAADKEGARVESLQADDRPATDTALGHLDLTLSIKAPYPSIIVVLQQVLDRYPGATLKQIDLAQVGPGAVPATLALPLGGQAASAPTVPSEARVLLSFWRRPRGVVQASVAAPAAPSASAAASAGSSPGAR
jgi:hypothetical protein